MFYTSVCLHNFLNAVIIDAPQDVDSFLRNVTDTVAVLEIAVKKVDKKAERYAGGALIELIKVNRELTLIVFVLLPLEPSLRTT